MWIANYLLLFLFLSGSTIQEVPVKLSACKVKLSNGKIIDLTSLDKESEPR